MKQFALALTTVLATGALAFAGSDSKDMKQVATSTPPVSCDYTWTGFYLGAHIGYGWSTGDTSFEALPSPARFGALETQKFSSDADGIFGGGQVGYNYQWNKLVFGFEGDFSGSDFEGTKHRSPIAQFGGGTTPGTLTAHEDTDWFGYFPRTFRLHTSVPSAPLRDGRSRSRSYQLLREHRICQYRVSGQHRRNQRRLDGWRRS